MRNVAEVILLINAITQTLKQENKMLDEALIEPQRESFGGSDAPCKRRN